MKREICNNICWIGNDTHPHPWNFSQNSSVLVRAVFPKAQTLQTGREGGRGRLDRETVAASPRSAHWQPAHTGNTGNTCNTCPHCHTAGLLPRSQSRLAMLELSRVNLDPNLTKLSNFSI